LTFRPRSVRTAIRWFPNAPEHSRPPTASATATRANALAVTLSPPTLLSAHDDAAVDGTANLLDLVFNETGSGEYRRYNDGVVGPDLGASKCASARLRESLRNETLFWVPGGQVQGPGRHWIVADHASGEDKVVATIGLFECEHDRDEASWVSLFAVHPDCRGLGLGTKLLRWAEGEARATGKKRLRLNTRARPDEAASSLYSTYGFSIEKEWGSGGNGPNHTIRVLEL
jgi:GNAT superfamily N-acetyltransferase